MAPWPRTLIGWGERPGSSPPDFIWWQEIHPDMTAEVAREAGYQVVEVVPVEKVEEAIAEFERRAEWAHGGAISRLRRDCVFNTWRKTEGGVHDDEEAQGRGEPA